MPEAADILKILGEVCRVPVEELTPEKHLIRDLDLDSVLALELLMTLEERLSVEISEVDAAKLVTVADVLDLIKQRNP
jgi:acyl carrier protein